MKVKGHNSPVSCVKTRIKHEVDKQKIKHDRKQSSKIKLKNITFSKQDVLEKFTQNEI